MLSAKVVLLILALVSFLLSALEVQIPRLNALGLGAFFVTLALLLS